MTASIKPQLPFFNDLPKEIEETTLNIIAEGTHIEGVVVFNHLSRVHGTVTGKIRAKKGSTLILSETAVIEGNIEADTLVIDGYVNGHISAKSRVFISRTGRVIGNIHTHSLTLEFGSYFEGQCSMSTKSPKAGVELQSLEKVGEEVT